MAGLQIADILRQTDTDPTIREQQKEPEQVQIVRKKYRFIIRDLWSESEVVAKDYDPYNVIEITGTKNEVARKLYEAFFNEQEMDDFTDAEKFEMIDNSSVYCKNVELSSEKKKNIWILASLYDFFKMLVSSEEVEPEMVEAFKNILDSYEAGAIEDGEENYDINDCRDVMKGE